jgi:hypothetical protein
VPLPPIPGDAGKCSHGYWTHAHVTAEARYLKITERSR